MNTTLAQLFLYQEEELIKKVVVEKNTSIPITIGRKGFGTTLDLDGGHISRNHAQIFTDDQENLIIKDLDSKGGTYVNNRQVSTALLQHNDSIVFSTGQSGYKIIVKLTNHYDTEVHKNNHTQLIDYQSQEIPEGMEISGNYTSDLTSLLAKKEEIVIGRAQECDIKLRQLTMSRKHAKIYKDDYNNYLIKDLDSKNGTFVNGQRISSPTLLKDTDDIHIGAYKFRLGKPPEDIRKQKAIIADQLIRTVQNGKIAILNDVSFKIPSCQFVAIMGPSGCGKSTLLKALNGDFPATNGKVYIHGIDLYENYDYLKHLIGYVPQDDIVHKELSVERSLFFAAKLRLSSDVSNKDIWEKIDEVLTNLNINDPEIRKRKIADLSGGQRKRVSIAVELLTDPSILFLDEPTSPLDPETIEDFLVCIRKLAEKGTTILMVTHKPNDLFYVDNIVFLSKGGYLTYYGSKDRYLDFFGAKNVIEVYSKNGTVEQGLAWSKKFNGLYPPSGVVHMPNEEIQQKRNEPFFKQLFWLTARYFNIKTNDRANTAILLAQAPIIAGLIALIFNELELSVLFFMTISAIWFGTNNAAKEIVGEMPIYRRERMFNLKILPYIFSKIIVLSIFSALQVIMFIGIVYALVGTTELSLNSYWDYVGWMLYIAFSSTLLGLFVSARLDSTDKVMTIIPIVLIPQIMLAGVITTLPKESAVEFMSYGMLSRWGTEGFAYLQDSIRSYIVDPLCPEDLIYTTVDAIEFMNLPNTIGLTKELSSNLWVIAALNFLIFLAMYWSLKRKDNI